MTAADRAQVDALFRRHQPMLLRALRRAFPRADQARLEDGAAQAWTQLCRKRPGWLEAERDPFPWLFTVASNHLRRSYARAAVSTDDDAAPIVPATAPEATPEAAHARIGHADLLAALATLTHGQKVALICNALGLSYAEACAATGQSYTWVNRHTTEGRAAMRALRA